MTTFRKIVLNSLALLFLFSTDHLSAQIVVTTNAGDESNGSLGWAVTTLNNAGAGAISIGNVGPITLTQPLAVVSQTVTFQGTNSPVIGQSNSQAQYLFQQGFTLDTAAALTLTNNGALSSGLDAAVTASSWNSSNNSSFFISGGAGTPQSIGGEAFVTLGTASAATGSNFQVQGGAGGTGTGLGGGNAGAAAVTAGSLSLSGAQGTIEGGLGGADSYQDGNGGAATLSLGALTLDSASQLQVVGGSVGIGNGAQGNGGNAVVTANSVSLTGSGTQLALFGGDGGSPQAVNNGPGPVNGGDGGSVSFAASSVTLDSQALFTVTGGQAGSVSATSSGRGGTGGSVTALLGSLDFTNGGTLDVVAGAGGGGAKGWIGGNAFVTVGTVNQGTGSTLNIVSGIGGGSSDGGALNFTLGSQTLASGATFIAQGNVGGSGAANGGNGGAVQVGGQALTLASGSLWEVLGGAGGTGTSTNGTGSNVFVNLHDLEGSGTVSLGGPGSQTLQLVNGNFSGALEGTEALAVVGYGVVTLTGNNTYSGGTTLSTGILNVNTDSNLGTGNLTLDGGTLVTGNFSTSKAVSLTANSGTFVVTPTDTASFNGVISGPGGLQLTGGGTFILGGDNTYTGTTNIANAILNVESYGQIIGPVLVSSGGTLQGYGFLSGAVTNNGTVQGGTGASWFLEVASYTQGANGTLNSVVSPTQSNNLYVNGSAALAGSLTVSQTAGTYSGITYRFPLLECFGGSLTGTFSTINENLLSNWAALVNYNSYSATLALYRTGVDFTPWATGANQTAAAQALNAAVSTGDDTLAPKLNELYALPSGQGTVLGQLTGDIYGALPGILLDNAQFGNSLLFDRLEGRIGPGMGDAKAPSMTSGQAGWVRNILSAEVSGFEGPPTNLATPSNRGLWVENSDSAGSVNGDGNVEGFTKSNYGFLAGYDADLPEGFTCGIMSGYMHTDVTGTVTGEKGGVDSVPVGVYGGKQFGSLQLDLVAEVCVEHLTVNRGVSIGGDLIPLSAAYPGSQFQGALQADYALNLSGFALKPQAGIEYAQMNQNRFSEADNTGVALSVPALEADSLMPYLGLDGSKYVALDQDLGFLPRVNLSVSQELLGSALSYQEAFTGAPNNSFTVAGITPSATTLGVEAGMKILFGKQLNLFANYQGHFSGTENLNTFNGGLDIAF